MPGVHGQRRGLAEARGGGQRRVEVKVEMRRLCLGVAASCRAGRQSHLDGCRPGG